MGAGILVPSMAPSSSSSPEKRSLEEKADDLPVFESRVTDSDALKISEAEKNALYRKMDWHIVPMLAVLIVMSFIDRGNIGNALSLGIIKDLKLGSGVKSNMATSIFFFSYFVFQLPSQIMLRLTSASKWLPLLMITWSIVLTLTGLVKSYEGLLVARFFLGIAEAGVVPGIWFYVSLWYPRASLARRIAYIQSTSTLGLAWGGILAYVIDKMEGVGGLHGWAWIFILEGILTFFLSILAFLVIPHSPERAKFLTETERAQLLQILREDNKGISRTFEWKYVLMALRDWKTYTMAAIAFGTLGVAFDIALFLPTIIRDLGFGAANAQLLLVPPHVLAWPIAVATCMLSDKVNMRGPFLMAYSALAVIGFAMLRSPLGTGTVGYVGTFFATIGSSTCTSLTHTWIGNNAGGEMKRAATWAISLAIAYMSGVLASFTYRTQDAPRYKTGHDVALAMLTLIFTFSGMMTLVFRHKNRKKEEFCEREGIDESRAEDFADLHDQSPLFKYTL